MRYSLRNVASLLILAFITYARLALAIDIDIAGETIRIPSPDGFTEVKSTSQDTFSMFEDMCPAQNRLLAVFVTQRDAGNLLRGDTADLREYMIVQSVKKLESMTLAKYQFSELRGMLRKEYDSLFQNQEESIDQAVAQAGNALSRRLDSDVQFNINGIVPLGVVAESASSITMSQLAKYDMAVSGENIQHTVAGSMTAALVKGKVLYLNVFRTYEGQKDVDWTRSQSAKWLPAIVSANEATWPRSTGGIVPAGTPVDLVTKELISEAQVEYNMKLHPKAHGLDISIKHPESWKAEEATRPHIVQKFTGESVAGISPSCMLVVQKLPAWASLFLEGDVAGEVMSESLREMVPPNASYIDGGPTKIDGEPGAWLKYYYQTERAGLRAGMYSLQYMLFYGGKMLAIQCSVGGLADDKEMLEDAFASYLPVFQMIGNSAVIHEKWSKAGSSDSVMEDVFGEFWWLTLLVSAVLTWGIGLAPPLLIRFAFVRRPLVKGAAIGLVVLFWFVNIIIFTALGSESKTHGALFLVAVASYYILRRRAKSSPQFTSPPPLPKEAPEPQVECPNCGKTSPFIAFQVDSSNKGACPECGVHIEFEE